MLNRALQQSNLGDFAEAEKLFDIARPLSQGWAGSGTGSTAGSGFRADLGSGRGLGPDVGPDQGRIQEIFKGGAIPTRGPYVCGAPTYPHFLKPRFRPLYFSGPPFSFFSQNDKKKEKSNKGPLGSL